MKDYGCNFIFVGTPVAKTVTILPYGVDAHLDAQNTERLSKIKFERSEGSQILMVTVKESTVAKATQIFGIYPKSGASEIVHYKNPDKIPLAQIKTSE